MKKKILALALVFSIILALAMPVFAADSNPVWSVEYDKNAKEVVITVDGVKQSFTNWKNNQAQEYTVNGWIISVTVKGNAIDKKALVGAVNTPDNLQAQEPVVESSTPSNSQIVTGTDTRIWQDGFGFHCNSGNGNGATSVINLRDGKTVKKGDQKNVFGTKTFPVTLERVGTTTLWNLMTDDIKCSTCGSTEWVTFSNNDGVINGSNIQAHHRSGVQINKYWVDNKEPSERPEAVFDIYKYDSKKDNGRGELVCENAVSSVKYQLEAGTYVIAERHKEGYIEQPDQRITVEEGKTTEVNFTNMQIIIDPPEFEGGEFNLTKTVNGVIISEWIINKQISYDDQLAIVNAISFKLYKAQENTSGEFNYFGDSIADGELTLDGNVTFNYNEPLNGWYAIVETFDEGSLAEELFEIPDPLYVFFNEGLAISGSTFDISKNYSVDFDKVNKYGSVILETKYDDSDEIYTSINRDGNPNAIYNISVMDNERNSYLSYCGSHGSDNFGSGFSYTVNNDAISAEKKSNIIKALNYIYEKYGSIDAWAEWGEDIPSTDGKAPGYIRPLTKENSTYTISQIVVWMILHDDIDYMLAISNNNNVKFGSEGIGNYYVIYEKLWREEYNDVINSAVTDVLSNYANQTNIGPVTGVMYLTTSKFEPANGIYSQYEQPQLIPIFDTVTFDNKPKDPGGEIDAVLNIKKTVDGTIISDWMGNNLTEEQKSEIIDNTVLFTLYKAIVEDDIPVGVDYENKVSEEYLGLSSEITFSYTENLNGWYAIVETFAPGSLAQELFEVPDTLYIFFVDGEANPGEGNNFDRDASYWCDSDTSPVSTNTYVDGAFISGTQQTNWWVANYKVEALDGKFAGRQYLSFCSYSSSLELGGDGSQNFVYYDKTKEFIDVKGIDIKNSIVYAFNYIVEKWGNLDTWLAFCSGAPWGETYTGEFYTGDWVVPTKYIAQIVNWKLLGDGFDPDLIKAIGPNGYNEDIFDFINGCVDEILVALADGYKSTQYVKDIVFLACEAYPEINLFCQPQIVPLFGSDITFDNKPKTPDGERDAVLNIQKTVDGIIITEWIFENYDDIDEINAILSDISFELYEATDYDGDGNYDGYTGGVIASCELDMDGKITFPVEITKNLTGWYAVVEVLGEKAAEAFEEVAPLFVYFNNDSSINIGNTENAAYRMGQENVRGFQVRYIFDPSLEEQPSELGTDKGYRSSSIWNLYQLSENNRYWLDNDWNNLIKGQTEDVIIGDAYCANMTSTFNDSYYKVGSVPSDIDKNRIIYIFDYVNDVYGLDTMRGRAVAQIATRLVIHGDKIKDIILCGDEFGDITSEQIIEISRGNLGKTSGTVLKVMWLVGYFKEDAKPLMVPVLGIFENKPKDTSYDGTINLTKTVDGTIITAWASDNYPDREVEIIEAISFKVYKANVDSEGNRTDGYDDETVIAVGELDINGEGGITFNGWIENPDGWYAVVEEFAAGSFAKQIFKAPKPLYVFFVDGEADVSKVNTFDVNVEYTVSENRSEYFFILGEKNNGLTGGGEVFPIHVTSSEGETFSAFCANAGSKSFGQGEYLKADILDSTKKIQIINALNYVYNTYGSIDSWDLQKVYDLIAQGAERPDGKPETGFYDGGWLPHPWEVEDATRLVSQVIVWNLLNDVELDLMLTKLNEGAANGYGWYKNNIIFNKEDNIYIDFINAIKDAINAANVMAEGPIVDIVLLKCNVHGGDCDETCQPQLVPIYGGTFDNKVNVTTVSVLTLSPMRDRLTLDIGKYENDSINTDDEEETEELTETEGETEETTEINEKNGEKGSNEQTTDDEEETEELTETEEETEETTETNEENEEKGSNEQTTDDEEEKGSERNNIVEDELDEDGGDESIDFTDI